MMVIFQLDLLISWALYQWNKEEPHFTPLMKHLLVQGQAVLSLLVDPSQLYISLHLQCWESSLTF